MIHSCVHSLCAKVNWTEIDPNKHPLLLTIAYFLFNKMLRAVTVVSLLLTLDLAYLTENF